MRLGGIEAGGTKFVVCVGDEHGNVLERTSFPTTTPQDTIAEVSKFFIDKNIEALGIGSFGPLDLNKESNTFGYITTTPKAGWANVDLLGELSKALLDIPMEIDTDVNAAALGESLYGCAKGLRDIVYLTVGTGIGGGIIANGQLVHGMMHPEMGHILLTRHEKDAFAGKCPYHSHCFEGLAAGPAIKERWGKNGVELDASHEAWEMEAWYIAQALAQYIMILSPQKIILGGGVMHQKQLFPMIREYVVKNLNGYIQRPELEMANLDQYIVEPGLGDNAGICGCLALAYNAKMYRK